MKIVIIIPAYNEQDCIGTVLNLIPRKIDDFQIETIIINDGSTDNTAKIARNLGFTVISHEKNQGLGFTLKHGLQEALDRNADIIINLDADGQYNPQEIPLLLSPMVNNGADLVLGSRFQKMSYKMPFIKRIGNKTMSFFVRFLTNTKITDAQTGFRAISRRLAELLLSLLRGTYTYTQEMIIHTHFQNLKIAEVPVTFNARIAGESRLIQSSFSYLFKVIKIIMTTYQDYKPLKFYGTFSIIIFCLGIVLLLIDNFFSLQGVHIFAGIDLSDNPKTLLTIFLPIIGGLILIMFGIVMEMVKNARNSILQSNLQLKALLEKKLGK